MVAQVGSTIADTLAYEAERKRAEALAEIDRAKTLFFSNISHEFRTPLTLMLAPLEDALSSSELSPTERDRLDVAHRNSLRLLKLVNSLLDFSRIEAGRAQASYEPTDLATFTADLASNFRAACEAAGLSLLVDCPPLDQPVYTDREMWEKIVLNLVSNAFKFTLQGEIRVGLRRDNGFAVLEVRDTGIGIAEAELPRIFERFHRIENAQGRTYEGSGIGLALVRELVRLNGGAVEVASAPGLGSTFTVRLPLGSAHLPADRIAAPRTVASTATRADAFVQEAPRWLPDVHPAPANEVVFEVDPLPPALAEGGRILIIDDNADMRHYLRQLLAGRYEVELAADGVQALDMIQGHRPDLVLTDVMMPRLDGFELLKALRARPDTKELPVILLSARAGEEAKVDGLDAGADDYLIKPFSARELLARIATNLEMAPVRRRAGEAARESEALLQAALVAGHMAYWRWDPEVDEVRASSTMEALFGLKAGEEWQSSAQGLALVHPEDRARHRAIVEEAARKGEGWETQFRIIRPCDGQIAWLEERANPITDAITGKTIISGLVWDVTKRRQAEEALLASEERLRQFGEASQDILWIRDADALQWQYLTPAFQTIYGVSRDEALAGDNYRSWLDLIVPEDRPRAHEAVQRAREGEHVTFEYRVRRPADGEIRWLRTTDFPIMDETGKAALIGGIGTDISEIRLSQDRLEQSEERLRNAIEVGRLGLWDWNILTGEIHWSDEHFRMEGYAVGEVIPSYEAWASRIHPDDRAATEEALREAQEAHTEYVREFRVVHPDGEIHWLYGRGRFFYDDQGRSIRMVGAMIDTTARRQWEERQRVLIAELQHRTRNLLSVVRSMAEKTARNSANFDDFRVSFRDRLHAMARVQALLSRLEEHDRVTFDDLIHGEMAAMDGGDRVTLSGPSGVRLRSSTVQTLAMALHELATNAVKYGALAQPSGQLAVTWSFEPSGEDGKPWLHIDWRECGVKMPPAGSAPRGGGQGRELIEQALPYQLSARTSYTLGSEGIHCTISAPVSANLEANAHG